MVIPPKIDYIYIITYFQKSIIYQPLFKTEPKYKVFSVYITDINDNYTKTSFEDKDEYKEFLERIKNKSIYKSDISVNENDKIITLSTCSYEFDDARLVVTGKLIDKEQ